ncbi:MAG TPA: hypothetical protein VHT24_05820 [Pseudacidobacterium sp.]|jgi:hypothetical protein|nr:hypothetical protein [Pseudacidobacterium sp.]
MSVNLSSAVQIIQNTSDVLKVYVPPNYPGGVLFFLLTIVSATIAIKSYGLKSQIVWGIASIVLVLFMLNYWTYHGNITLSRTAQTFTFEERTLYYNHTQIYPLNALSEAIVKPGRYQNRMLALLMSSGQQLSVGEWYSSRGGIFQAAHAINAFLADNTQR